MKISHLAFILLAVVISSCSKEQQQSTSTEQDISVSQVPARIASYVDNNYPDAYIYTAVTVSNGDAKTIVTLNTTEELAFNSNDDFMGNGAQFHPGHHGMGHGGMGHGNGNGHCHGFNHGDFDDIPIDSLSSAITSYITSNYAGYQILHAEKDSSCAVGSVIEVMVRTTGAEPIKLIFDPSGNYIMSAMRIDYSTTPLAVQNSITANYAGYTPRHKSEKFTLAGGQIQYGVFVFNGSTHKRVILTDVGTVICDQ